MGAETCSSRTPVTTAPGSTSTGGFLTTWGSGGPGDGQFNGPAGVAVDSGGNVFVADSINRRVQKFDNHGVSFPVAHTTAC
jgi:DNA-binding beta-propeller fold protein YncE